MFFVFDGLDGSGKTTQLDRFVISLEALDRTVVVAKDPGTTALGEQLRSILLNSSDMPIHMRAEMMMFTTARTQLVEEIVRPALANDHIVVLDRYVLSTVVYQGIAGKLDPDSIRTINQIATDDIWPDHTFILDLPVDVAMGRLGKDLDRMESRGKSYFEKVRKGFVDEANARDDVTLIDANRTPDEIEASIRTVAQSHFGLFGEAN